jgi:hypothetical protein
LLTDGFEKAARYQEYTAESNQVKWFWEVLRTFDTARKHKVEKLYGLTLVFFF